MVDALAMRDEEGRGLPAISLGKVEATFDPRISELGNLLYFVYKTPLLKK